MTKKLGDLPTPTVEKMIKITFTDGREITMPKENFRRMIVVARTTLNEHKRHEKSMFPEVDQITLNIIEAIQSQYTDLI